MPEQNLHVALLPIDIKLGSKEHNLKAISDRILDLPNSTDVVLLPELSNIGFGKYPAPASSLAESTEGDTIAQMKCLSEECNLAICGGFIRKEDGKIFNSCFFVADGELKAIYDKRHLFPGPESKIFTPGCSLPPIIEYKTWKLRPSICYDLRFPVWNRAQGNNFDVMLLIANWPHSRYYAWRHLSIARAIENQIYVASCNREGEDVYGSYQRGDSLIFNDLGNEISSPLSNGTVIGTFDATALNDNRKTLQPWRAADNFTLNL